MHVAFIGLVSSPLLNTTTPTNGLDDADYADATNAVAAFLTKDQTDETVGVVVYDGTSREDLVRLREDIRDVFLCPEVQLLPLHIAPKLNLVGVPAAVYHRINAALKSGKRHLILYGPPGTGKTTIAQYIAGALSSSGDYKMLTASSSWTSQELIGGYQPIGAGEIGFVPGIMLRHFDKPVIIDELNRCPIDRVIGPLFSILSDQSTTLPYRTDVRNPDSEFHVILPTPKNNPASFEWCPRHDWRIIATLNTVDKSQLSQISYALSRRFAWIRVDVPADQERFVEEIIVREQASALRPLITQITDMWCTVNSIREIGGAPIIDFIKMVSAMWEEALGETSQDRSTATLMSALSMVILPLLDGISVTEAEQLQTGLNEEWCLDQEMQSLLTDLIMDWVA